MTDISKEILEKYQIRKSKKQKLEFIEFLRAHFPELRVEKGGFGGNRNIVIGDVDNAKAVFTAHYDTCAVMPIPNFIMPKSILISILYSLVLVIPMLVIAMLIGGGIGYLAKNSDVGQVVFLFVYFLCFFLMMAGPANKHTVNDNTSGVITLVELLSTLSEEQKAKCAFVFFDNEELGLLGSAFFASKHKKVMKDKLLVNFDCVSDGDTLLLIANKKAYPEYAEALSTAFKPVGEAKGKTVLTEGSTGVYYPSDQGNFKKNVGVAAFKKCKLGLYMDRIHTPKDTVMDEKNIEILAEGTAKFIDTL